MFGKNEVKNILSRCGLLPYVDWVRKLPDCLVWLFQGTTGYAPAPVKRAIISAYLERYCLPIFVETGTYLGDTLGMVAYNKKIKCISIELSKKFYMQAKKRFANYKNVKLLKGDSGIILPKVITNIKKPALFWLDGHYSGDATAQGSLQTPVINELNAVLASPIQGHVILIDDIRNFNGTHDYPYLDEVLLKIRTSKRFDVEISGDVARITPRNQKPPCKKL